MNDADREASSGRSRSLRGEGGGDASFSSREAKARCTMGVGCDEHGVCYAVAHGQPDQCMREPAAPTGLRDALLASLTKRLVATMDPPYTAAFNAALDMVARDCSNFLAFADATRPQVSDEPDQDWLEGAARAIYEEDRVTVTACTFEELRPFDQERYRRYARAAAVIIRTQPSQAIPDARAGLREALQKLAVAVKNYRAAVEMRGNIDRAWERMTHAEQQAFAALAAPHPIARADDGEGVK